MQKYKKIDIKNKNKLLIIQKNKIKQLTIVFFLHEE